MHRFGRVGTPGTTSRGVGADRGMHSPELHWAAHAHHRIPVSLWAYLVVGVQSWGEFPPKIYSVVIPKQRRKMQALPQDIEFSEIRKLREKRIKPRSSNHAYRHRSPVEPSRMGPGYPLMDQGTLWWTGPILTVVKGGKCMRGKTQIYAFVCQKHACRPAPFRECPAERQGTGVSLSQGREPAPVPVRWVERHVQAWGAWGRTQCVKQTGVRGYGSFTRHGRSRACCY